MRDKSTTGCVRGNDWNVSELKCLSARSCSSSLHCSRVLRCTLANGAKRTVTTPEPRLHKKDTQTQAQRCNHKYPVAIFPSWTTIERGWRTHPSLSILPGHTRHIVLSLQRWGRTAALFLPHSRGSAGYSHGATRYKQGNKSIKKRAERDDSMTSSPRCSRWLHRQMARHVRWVTGDAATRTGGWIWNRLADQRLLQSARGGGGAERRQSPRKDNGLNGEGESNPVWASFSSNGTLSLSAVLDCTGTALSTI